MLFLYCPRNLTPGNGSKGWRTFHSWNAWANASLSCVLKSILQCSHKVISLLVPPCRLSCYPFAISTILLITNMVIAKFFHPIRFLYLDHLQPCTNFFFQRKLKLDNIQGWQVISTASKTSVATTDAIFDSHDSSGILNQKSYCTSRGLTLFLLQRNLFFCFAWTAFLLFSGSDCRNNFLFCFIIPHNSSLITSLLIH